MRCVIGVELGLLSERELREEIGDIAEMVARQNARFIRKFGRRRIPRLYDAGLPYREDPWGPEFQHFPHALTLIRRGYVDCKGAVPWLLADLREEYPHEQFSVHAYVRRLPGNKLDVHLQIKKPPSLDGVIVDPSRLLQRSQAFSTAEG